MREEEKKKNDVKYTVCYVRQLRHRLKHSIISSNNKI